MSKARGRPVGRPTPEVHDPFSSLLPVPAELAQAADLAIESGGVVVFGDLLIVSDTAERVGVAAGLPPLPEGYGLRRRRDGRMVHLFRAPAGRGWFL